MAERVTKVRLDSSDARKEIDRLKKKIQEAKNNIKNDFNVAADASSGFREALGRISPAFNRAIDAASRLGPVGLAAAGALTAVGAAGAFVVNQIGNLPQLLLDTNEQLDRIRDGLRDAQRFDDLSSSIEDAGARFQLTERRERLADRQVALTARQNELEEVRANAQQILQLETQRFAGIERAASTSASNRISIEERLRDKLREIARDQQGPGGQAPAGRQVVDLSAQAERAARSGDVDAAEELVRQAKALSAELGNHVFFTDKIDSANRAIARELEKQVGQAQQQERADNASLSAAARRVQAARDEVNALKDRQRELRADQRTLGADRQQLRGDLSRQRRSETGAQAARDARTAANEIQSLGNAVDSFRDNFERGLGVVGNTLTKNGARTQELRQQFDALRDSANDIAENVLAGTPERINLAVQQSARLREILTNLETDPNFGGDLLLDIEKIRDLLQSVDLAGRAAAQARTAGISPTEQISGGAARVEQERLNRLQAQQVTTQAAVARSSGIMAGNFAETARSAEQIRTNLTNLRLPAAAPSTASRGGSSQPANVTQTFNVRVTGGIIDRETTETILDIVRREIRKVTSQGLQ